MSFVTRNLKQDVTYWSPSSFDQFGNQVWGTPAVIKGRWEDRTDLFIIETGEEVRSRARVYLNSDVVVGGYLFLGVSSSTDPGTVTGAREIRDFRKIPTITADLFERRALL